VCSKLITSGDPAVSRIGKYSVWFDSNKTATTRSASSKLAAASSSATSASSSATSASSSVTSSTEIYTTMSEGGKSRFGVTFAGHGEDVGNFFAIFEARTLDLTEGKSKIAALMQCLTNEVIGMLVMKTKGKLLEKNFGELKKILEETYTVPDSVIQAAKAAVERAEQREDEAVIDYANRLQPLFVRATIAEPAEQIRYFLAGLQLSILSSILLKFFSK